MNSGGGLNQPRFTPSRAGLRGRTSRNTTPGPPCWGLGVSITTSPRKNNLCYGNYYNYNSNIWPYDHIFSDPTPGMQGWER